MPPADQPAAAPARASSPGVGDAVALLQGVPLTAGEAAYVEAARAANTLRGYRFDWAESTAYAPAPAWRCCRGRPRRSPAT